MTACLWLIGGTQESAELARALSEARLPYIVTVTTAPARSLYPVASRVWVGRLTAATMLAFVTAHAIGAILDASHPFAVEVSELAIATAQQAHLPYLRFERLAIAAARGGERCASVADLLATGALTGERVLLTLGYRMLAQFQPWQTRSTLFARILPSVIALEAALAAGFTPDRVMALRPPISRDLERSLWQQWQISLVVTKASGMPGGESVKQQVAAELGVKLWVIDRPPIAYPAQTSEVAAALKWSWAWLGGREL